MLKISGKHKVEEINGVRCSVVEKEATEERAKFLMAVLEHNGYKVQIQKNIPVPPKIKKAEEAEAPVIADVLDTYKVGVTDIAFNSAIMVFSRKLKTLANKIILPTYWNQEEINYQGWYWKFKK